ncbi:MAG: DUF6178 family protein [Myxococcota bacterium]
MQHVLELARRDRKAAGRVLAEESLERQVELVCETPVRLRARIFDLLPEPEKVIPELPEAELCFSAKAVGLEDAGWMLEHATPEQLVTAVDLDAWRGTVADLASFGGWMAALADAGRETLARAARAMDPELLVLSLKHRLEVWLKPSGDDWQPPPGARTLDGQFYFRARAEGDDLADLVELLSELFQSDYWLYFRLLQGTIWELPSETEEWALRWRNGRLEDLGFPSWDEAMRIYGYVRPDERARLGASGSGIDIGAWRLPVWLPGLPAGAEARHSIFRTIAKLPDEERRACFYAFVALANRVAVADRMPLSDAESTPAAIDKAAFVVSRGLDYVASENGLDPAKVLRRVSLVRLFRVGASLDPASRPPVPSGS